MKTYILKTFFISALLIISATMIAQNGDWGKIKRYQTKNKKPVESKRQIDAVFIGNSITENG